MGLTVDAPSPRQCSAVGKDVAAPSLVKGAEGTFGEEQAPGRGEEFALSQEGDPQIRVIVPSSRGPRGRPPPWLLLPVSSGATETRLAAVVQDSGGITCVGCGMAAGRAHAWQRPTLVLPHVPRGS